MTPNQLEWTLPTVPRTVVKYPARTMLKAKPHSLRGSLLSDAVWIRQNQSKLVSKVVKRARCSHSTLKETGSKKSLKDPNYNDIYTHEHCGNWPQISLVHTSTSSPLCFHDNWAPPQWWWVVIARWPKQWSRLRIIAAPAPIVGPQCWFMCSCFPPCFTNTGGVDCCLLTSHFLPDSARLKPSPGTKSCLAAGPTTWGTTLKTESVLSSFLFFTYTLW